jgi:hypothetical protein
MRDWERDRKRAFRGGDANLLLAVLALVYFL